ncbi:PTS sugar transporter subunit IIA, partial [Enterococcus faecalis]
NGVMVSKLVRANMEKLFPEIHFLASLSVRDFYKFEVDYDLVFTTTPLNSAMMQFIIDPIMTYQEQISLRYRVLSDLGITKVDRALDELLKIVKKYATVNDQASLREELQYFLVKQDESTPLDNFQVLPSLTHYLRPNYVQVIDQEMTWEEAVSLACQPLLDHQIIDSRFINDCVNQIKQPGYAGYLGMRTCIPHTTVDKGVINDGVSIMVCQKPVIFPNGEAISLILPLSFFDLTKHLRAINQIADIAKDDSLIDQLVASADEKTIYQLLRQSS